MSKGQREMTYEELKYAYMKKVQRVHELEDAVESYKMAEEQNKRYRDMLVKIFKIVQNHQIMKISDEDYADAATFLYKWIYDTGAIDREKHFSEVHGHDEFDSHQINLLFKEHMSQKSSKALEGEE